MRSPHTVALFLPLVTLCLGPSAGAGPLNPPTGAITSTAKPLAEIEPRTAISAANTPGDADSLFRITQPGSYYLTGNVNGVAGKVGIEIAASGVTLDLNGFELLGVPGSLSGTRPGANISNVTIKNGSARNWGEVGVSLAVFQVTGARIESVHASGNGGAGIFSGDGCVVTGCAASANAASGIATGAACVVSGCVAYSNAGTGINASGGCHVVDCTSYSNAGTGISVGSGGTVSRCTVLASGTYGIGTSSSCTVEGCTVRGSAQDGIRCAGSGSVIRDNVCAVNGSGGEGAGIVVVSVENKIEGNHCSNNDRGIDVQVAGNFIVRNTCSDNTVQWVIVANNVYGPIINRSAPASAAVNGPAAASTLGSTDPHANFTY
ncbi:MAG TPA: right-handed parallel beta-helix repeat-containing protein [Phycisphaerales bacterium]|nr:right-handed parallel beta-helix repeat-containing protein [Phycisphaerales bacterium]